VAERDGSDPAALLYTGGTTGASKGVVLSHHNLEWTARAAREGSEVEADHIGLLVLPLSHGFGLGVSILGVLSPSRSVLLRWFDVDAVLDAIERHRIQRMAVVPTMVQMLLTADLESRDLSSLTYITSGGAAMPEEVLRAWERRVPNCPILQGYGLTETSPTITVQRPSSVEDGTRKVGSVGRPIDGVEVRIVDDADRPLGPGEVGEVTARGPNVMRGYWRNPGATADAVRDGWFHTGDMGYLDADGDLFIVDRKKDLIIRGGFNVFPNDVEAALLESPQVLEAAVVARPSEKYGEEPVAFVSLAPGATVEDVTAYCEERLAKYKRPAEVRAVPAVPKTPVGKIDRKALRAELA
jgi:long-chain acyl-CoA synthetase